MKSADAGGLGHEVVKERVTGELKKAFKPEFLNRVDEVIVFHDLTSDEIEQIVDVMVDRLRGQLMLQGFGITLSGEARKMLAAEGFDSDARRPAAQARDPAPARGPALRADPGGQLASGRRDRGRS